MKRSVLAFVVAAVAIAAFTPAAHAQFSATTAANISAVVVTPITLTKTSDMSFSKVSSGAAGGTVLLGTDGSRTPGGTVTVGGANGTAAAFLVQGDANATYSISLPATPSAMAGGAPAMTVDTFISSPPAAGGGTLSGTGSQTLLVGATLHVNAAQSPGTYSGTFSVTVAYN